MNISTGASNSIEAFIGLQVCKCKAKDPLDRFHQAYFTTLLSFTQIRAITYFGSRPTHGFGVALVSFNA